MGSGTKERTSGVRLTSLRSTTGVFNRELLIFRRSFSEMAFLEIKKSSHAFYLLTDL
jgi:hypothetical protein